MTVSRNEDIHAALKNHLRAFCVSGGHALAFLGYPFPVPPETQKPGVYLEEMFLPNSSRQKTLGAEAQSKRGIYQVSVYTNSNSGWEAEKALADSIVDLFANATLRSGSAVVQIISEPYWSSPVHGDGWTQIPVTINYTCEV